MLFIDFYLGKGVGWSTRVGKPSLAYIAKALKQHVKGRRAGGGSHLNYLA
jgi:hypothetical protein